MRDGNASFEAMSTGELERMCTDLSIAAALAVPGGAGQAAIERELPRVAAVLAARERGWPPPGIGTAGTVLLVYHIARRLGWL